MVSLPLTRGPGSVSGAPYQRPWCRMSSTVGETFKAARQAYKPYSPKFDAEYGADLVRLAVDEHTPTAQLDTFSRRKAAAGLSLMRRPTVLLMDEPAAGLINSEVDEIDHLLRLLSRR